MSSCFFAALWGPATWFTDDVFFLCPHWVEVQSVSLVPLLHVHQPHTHDLVASYRPQPPNIITGVFGLGLGGGSRRNINMKSVLWTTRFSSFVPGCILPCPWRLLTAAVGFLDNTFLPGLFSHGPIFQMCSCFIFTLSWDFFLKLFIEITSIVSCSLPLPETLQFAKGLIRISSNLMHFRILICTIVQYSLQVS